MYGVGVTTSRIATAAASHVAVIDDAAPPPLPPLQAPGGGRKFGRIAVALVGFNQDGMLPFFVVHKTV